MTSAPTPSPSCPADRWFQLTSNGTDIRREIVGGLTTFAAMAYILAVNPSILSTTGMDKAALVTATGLAAALMTLLMALMTNYPIALAPGMGLNAFFAFSLCGQYHIPWQDSLGLVFYSGCIFLLLTASGIRQKLIEAIPADFKTAITCGIGFFIAFIGLKNGGLVVANPATFVTIGSVASPEPLLVLLGIIGTAVCIIRQIPGAVILNIIAITIIDLVLQKCGVIKSAEPLPTQFVGLPASLSPILFQLHLGYLWSHLVFAAPLVLSILFVDLFDNMGTLIGVCKRANLLDENGNLPKIGRAFTADAGAAIIGSCLGTSTVTSYIESAAGVEAGARTGLSSIVTALCFLLALFLAPLIAIIPDAATAPALIIIGILMFQSAAQLDLSDLSRAVPVTFCIIMMALTFSISEGIALGLLIDLAIKIGLGRWSKIGLVETILCALFCVHYVYKPA